MDKERLLNVAKALRESPNPHMFDMGMYVNGCGTPACALGHFANRTDLQDICCISPRPGSVNEGFDIRYVMSGRLLNYNDDQLLKYLDISEEEACELFATDGCGDARTPIQAAEYIERFVAENS